MGAGESNAGFGGSIRARVAKNTAVESQRAAAAINSQ